MRGRWASAEAQPQRADVEQVLHGLEPLRGNASYVVDALRDHLLSGLGAVHCSHYDILRDLDRADYPLHNQIGLIAEQWHNGLKHVLRRQWLERQGIRSGRDLVVDVSNLEKIRRKACSWRTRFQVVFVALLKSKGRDDWSCDG